MFLNLCKKLNKFLQLKPYHSILLYVLKEGDPLLQLIQERNNNIFSISYIMSKNLEAVSLSAKVMHTLKAIGRTNNNAVCYILNNNELMSYQIYNR